MAQIENRRKLKNTIVDTGAQLRLLIPFLTLLLLSTGLLIFVNWRVLQTLSYFTSATSPDSSSVAEVQELSNIISIATTGGVFILAIVTLGCWLFYSHHIFGPIVPIIRKLKELDKGDSEEPIKLRKFDELGSIANAVNDLSENFKRGLK